MHIWLFNPFDDLPWEGKPQRYATLARSLVGRGHTVVHWSSDFSHRLKAKRAMPEAAVLETLPYAVELVPTRPYARNVGCGRVLNHRQYGRGLVRLGRARVAAGALEKPDVILASMPPLEGPGAALQLKKTFGCRVVLDMMDAWPATLLQAVPPWARLLGRVALIPYALQLTRACREADALTAQSRTFADFAHRNGAEGKATYICLLGADPVENPEKTDRVREAEEPLRLLYLGAMGRSYDLATVVNAVERINRDKVQVELVFVGDGEKRAPLEARKVPHVEYTGFLSGEARATRLLEADLGIVPFFPDSGVAVPYKAGEYLAYALPLISSIDGELGELIRHAGCGVVYEAGDVPGLAALLRAYCEDRSRVAEEQRAALNCFREVFDRSQAYPAFAAWIEEHLG